MFESQLFACGGFFYLLLHYKTIVNKSVEKNQATKLLSTNLLKQLNNNQNLLDRGLSMPLHALSRGHAAMTGPLMGLIDA